MNESQDDLDSLRSTGAEADRFLKSLEADQARDQLSPVENKQVPRNPGEAFAGRARTVRSYGVYTVVSEVDTRTIPKSGLIIRSHSSSRSSCVCRCIRVCSVVERAFQYRVHPCRIPRHQH